MRNIPPLLLVIAAIAAAQYPTCRPQEGLPQPGPARPNVRTTQPAPASEPSARDPVRVLVVVHLDGRFAGAARVARGVLGDVQRGRAHPTQLVVVRNPGVGDLVPRVAGELSVESPDGYVAPDGWPDGLAVADEWVVEGGYLGGCLAQAVRAILERDPRAVVLLPWDRVYASDNETLLDRAVGAPDQWTFLGEVGRAIRANWPEGAPQFVTSFEVEWVVLTGTGTGTGTGAGAGG